MSSYYSHRSLLSSPDSSNLSHSIRLIIGIVVGVIVFLVVCVGTCKLLCCAKSTKKKTHAKKADAKKADAKEADAKKADAKKAAEAKKKDAKKADAKKADAKKADANKADAKKTDAKKADAKKADAKKTKALEDDDSQLIHPAMVQFLDDMEREKPIRFTSEQLRIYTCNFSILLGSGGFGIVYKGIIAINKYVAVKVLTGSSNQQIEEQFMAEMSTMGRIHHFNLVRLYGFCFEPSLIALVYEFMINGSLDKHLFKANKGAMLGFDKLYEIALGTGRGIRYLHEECAQRIVHYDIKPGNILLDSNFCAKVADFGLAKLSNREKTHITMTGGRGTPGYAAPELWMPLPVTHKCDVYSFGMLLFEIIGRRRNMDTTLSDSLQWFPVFAWDKYEKNQLEDLMINCEIEEKDYEVVEMMLKVAFCCVQYRAENRPTMSIVVKMLEGMLEVPARPLNPFAHLFSGGNESNISLNRMSWNVNDSNWSSSEGVTGSTRL